MVIRFRQDDRPLFQTPAEMSEKPAPSTSNKISISELSSYIGAKLLAKEPICPWTADSAPTMALYWLVWNYVRLTYGCCQCQSKLTLWIVENDCKISHAAGVSMSLLALLLSPHDCGAESQGSDPTAPQFQPSGPFQ